MAWPYEDEQETNQTSDTKDSNGNPILNLRVNEEEKKENPLRDYGDESKRTKDLDDEIPF